MLIKPYFLIPFLLISFLNIFFEIKEYKKGRFLTKPLLMPLLLLFYVLNVIEPNIFIIIALIYGFLGDVFLMWSHKKIFIFAGITSFLTGHIFYIITYLDSTNYFKDVPIWFLIFLLPYIILGILLLKKLFPSMKSMKLPTSIYMSVISTMSFTSLTRIFSVSFHTFLLPFLGSLLFLLSDTILAIDMFKKHNKDNDVYVMSTYILAQFLIIFGFTLI